MNVIIAALLIYGILKEYDSMIDNNNNNNNNNNNDENNNKNNNNNNNNNSNNNNNNSLMGYTMVRKYSVEFNKKVKQNNHQAVLKRKEKSISKGELDVVVEISKRDLYGIAEIKKDLGLLKKEVKELNIKEFTNI